MQFFLMPIEPVQIPTGGQRCLAAAPIGTATHVMTLQGILSLIGRNGDSWVS